MVVDDLVECVSGEWSACLGGWDAACDKDSGIGLVVRVETEWLWARGLTLSGFGDFVGGGGGLFGLFGLFWFWGRARRVCHAEVEFGE